VGLLFVLTAGITLAPVPANQAAAGCTTIGNLCTQCDGRAAAAAAVVRVPRYLIGLPLWQSNAVELSRQIMKDARARIPPAALLGFEVRALFPPVCAPAAPDSHNMLCVHTSMSLPSYGLYCKHSTICFCLLCLVSSCH
jgi:hypothetical protein